MRLLLAATASIMLLLGSAYAQAPSSEQDLTGMWFIQVFGHPTPEPGIADGRDKVADGSIAFARVGEGDYDCTFSIAFNFDPSRRYGDAGAGWAVQTCRATVTDGAVNVQSTVVRADGPDYRPDNFQLTIVSGERMTGTTVSETDGRGAPFLVVFRRR